MKAKYFVLTPILLGFLYVMLLSNSSGAASAGNGNRTGSPGSNGTCASCHSGGSFGTTITASVTDLNSNPVTSYIPGDTFLIDFQVSSTSGSPKYGFQSLMLNSSNANIGNFDAVYTTNTQLTTVLGKEYAEHSAKSTTGYFQVSWVAPASGTGTVTLYYIGNAVNSSFSTAGDSPSSAQSLSLSEQLFFTATTSETSAITCYGSTNGEAMATVANGVAPYTYVWSTGTNSGAISATTHSVTGLGSGTYYVTVTDGNLDVSIDSITLIEPTVLSTAQTIVDESCYQLGDGSALISVSGGTAPYTYSWSNGSILSQISNVTAGSYVVTITDDNGCVLVDTALVNGPTQINLGPTVVDPTCVNASNGQISLVVSGGVSPYSYTWSNGETSSVITLLDTGMYDVTVTDASGCEAFGMYTLSSVNFPPVITLSSTNPTCNTSSDGTISATVTGGNAPFIYMWNNGDTTLSIANADTGLNVFVVADGNACIAFDSVSLLSNNIVPIVDLGPDTVICDTSVGVFQLNAGSLVNDYSYLWSTADTSYAITIFFTGNYLLQVTDALGCIGSDSINVGEIACATSVVDLFDKDEIKVFPQPAKDILHIKVSKNAEIKLYDIFGKMVLKKTIESGTTNLDISTVSAGTYILHVTNADGQGIKKIMIL